MTDYLRGNLDGFDRTTYAPAPTRPLTQEEQQAAFMQNAEDQARLLLHFLAVLKTQLGHEEALVLAGQVWRAG